MEVCRTRSVSRLTVVLFSALTALCSAQGVPTVWVTPSLHRVGMTDAPTTTTQAQMYGARGAYDAFQIVVTAPSGGLTNVNVSVSALTGPSTIPQSSFTLYREMYVNVNQGSPNWGGSNQPLGPGWYADALIPFTNPATGQPLSGATYTAVPTSVTASQNQPFWVDLLIPSTATAGNYTGTYTVTSDQGNYTGQIALTVWNFAMPSSPYLKSAFLFWTAGNLASLEELMKARLMPSSVPTANEASLMSTYGLNTTDVGFYSGASAGNCVMSAAPSVSQFQAAAEAQQPGLPLYDYSADEIGGCTNLYSTMQQWAANMHAAGISNLVTMAPTTALFSDGTGSGRSAVDDWVMLPEEYNASTSTVTQALAKGDSAWSYNTLVQDAYSPKWEIDFAPVNFRLQPGFISQTLGLTGLLYWRVDDFISSNPWTDVNNAGTFSSNNYPGEGMLFYPGTQVGLDQVVPSMRLKWLRDGVEDYDYVQILKNQGGATQALQISQSVGPDWTNWTRSESAVVAARVQVGQAINALAGGTTTTTPPPTPPSTPTTTPAPGAVTSPSPANSASAVAISATVSWGAASNATSYDVYFGTSSTPAFVATVPGTSYNPGTLSNGTVYHWNVVAKNATGTTASATWSFTTASAAPPTTVSTSSGPTAVSVSPSPWTGWGHNFTFTYSDPAGYANLSGGGALISSTFNGINGCWFWYNQSSNAVLLASNNTTTWSSLPVSPWGANPTASVSNSQCTIWGAWTQASGNNLTVVVSVSFATAFDGSKTAWLYTIDNSGKSSGYQPEGTFTITPQ